MSALQKQSRIPRDVFSMVFKTGTRLHSPFVTLIYKESKSFHGSVVVGKKVNKAAVQRNKIRRMVYAVLYSVYIKNSLPYTVIVILKPKAKTITPQALRDHVRDQIGRITKSA